MAAIATSIPAVGFSTKDIMISLAQSLLAAEKVSPTDPALQRITAVTVRAAQLGETLAKEPHLPVIAGAISAGIAKLTVNKKTTAASSYSAESQQLQPEHDKMIADWNTLRAQYKALLKNLDKMAHDLVQQLQQGKRVGKHAIEALASPTIEMKKKAVTLDTDIIKLEARMSSLYKNIYDTLDLQHQTTLMNPNEVRTPQPSH